MASTTPNIGLTLPTGGERVSRQIINDNNTIIDGKMGAVPGGQNLQGEIDALNSKIDNVVYRGSVDVSILVDNWARTAREGEYVTVGSSLAGTFLNGADSINGALTLARTGLFSDIGYGYITFHSSNNTLYARAFNYDASSVTWRGALQKLATMSDITPQTVTVVNYGGWSNFQANCVKIGNIVVCQIYGDNNTGTNVNVFGSGFPTPYIGMNFSVANYGAGGTGVETYWAYLSNGVLTLRTPIAPGDSLFGTLVYVCQ